ncbi:hypothetical protein HED60_19425 [Planctomycetales bacterium ZRK34]|nr:hypothetical protein HED60_19425 [Planctomycetales bacterium ZRK34]
MMMNVGILRDELTNDPLEVGYASMTDAEAATALNLPDRTRVISRRITSLTILSELGADAAEMLERVATAAQTNKAVAIALQALQSYSDGGGIDIGNDVTRSTIDTLLAAEVLSDDEANALKAMATETISRATELGLGHVASRHVANIRGGE